MVLPDEVARLLKPLDDSGIPYAVTGSLASSAWGRPRATYDVDILIALRAADVDGLLGMLPGPDWYVDRQAALDAIAAAGEFNAIHAASGRMSSGSSRCRDPRWTGTTCASGRRGSTSTGCWPSAGRRDSSRQGAEDAA
ncbi:hypothetical protein RAS1_11630 [Phycisphaerae bacterium RAS1]|nr:hypothetical protein RAS1_11630 [Phycisphaerae bacterium RAS1]